jgi:hypothetical protein
MTTETNGNGFREIRCSGCGRFLGSYKITDGEIDLLCKCRNVTVILAGQTEIEYYKKRNIQKG